MKNKEKWLELKKRNFCFLQKQYLELNEKQQQKSLNSLIVTYFTQLHQ